MAHGCLARARSTSSSYEPIPGMRARRVTTTIMQVSMSLQKQYGNLKLTWEELKTNSSRKMLNLKSYLCLKGEETNMKNDVKCALCPTNWYLIGGTCYYISKGSKSWQESKMFCDARNSTLLILNEENKKWIKESLLDAPNTYLWIGIYKDKSGQWFWVNGTPFVTTPKWFHPGSKEAECAYLYYRESVYTTAECNSHQYQWICEKAAAELSV
ncbi:CD209 antigen-like protein E [Elgaria multicarinata webbii]|uniref:CD209 antigen-like protein E n=1 Tax=Elgaria multicarinata webbii TaxID=159646 RepID=UPI002FCD2B82